MQEQRKNLKRSQILSLMVANNVDQGNCRIIYGQWKESPSVRDDAEELRLKLETERQEVLGKLSFMTPADKQYRELDQKFKELTEEIKKLK